MVLRFTGHSPSSSVPQKLLESALESVMVGWFVCALASNHSVVLMCFQGTLLLGVGVFTLSGTQGKYAVQFTLHIVFFCFVWCSVV